MYRKLVTTLVIRAPTNYYRALSVARIERLTLKGCKEFGLVVLDLYYLVLRRPIQDKYEFPVSAFFLIVNSVPGKGFLRPNPNKLEKKIIHRKGAMGAKKNKQYIEKTF